MPTYTNTMTGETRTTKDIDAVLWYEGHPPWTRLPLPEPATKTKAKS